MPTNHLRAGVTWINNPAMGPVSTALQTQNAGFQYAGQSGQPANQYFGTIGNVQAENARKQGQTGEGYGYPGAEGGLPGEAGAGIAAGAHTDGGRGCVCRGRACPSRRSSPAA